MQPDAPDPVAPTQPRARPRFPWVSLAGLILAALGVLTAVGLGIGAAVAYSDSNDQALAQGIAVHPGTPAGVEVDGADDTVHIALMIPRDASAWRTDGTFALPAPTILATQEGRPLFVETDPCPCAYSYDVDKFSDGSTAVHVADVEPDGAGLVRISAGDIAPASGLLATRTPSYSASRNLGIAAGIVAGASVLIGLIALICFIVFMFRWFSARPRRPRPAPYGAPYPGPYGGAPPGPGPGAWGPPPPPTG
jgi:hypothetical protein